MARTSGSKKGTPFEREISKELSWWWSWGERDDLVWRSQTSGGRATQRMKSGQMTKYQFGDFTPQDPCIYPLFDLLLLEAKRGYNKLVDVLDHLDLPDHRVTVPAIREWWIKAEEDRSKCGRHESMIFLKRDGRERLVVISSKFLNRISVLAKCPYTENHILVDNLIITRMADFFTFFEPEFVAQLLDVYTQEH